MNKIQTEGIKVTYLEVSIRIKGYLTMKRFLAPIKKSPHSLQLTLMAQAYAIDQSALNLISPIKGLTLAYQTTFLPYLHLL